MAVTRPNCPAATCAGTCVQVYGRDPQNWPGGNLHFCPAVTCAGTCAQVYGPDPQRWPGGNLRFPGGQPVSLDRQNISLLHEKRYWVTWKADGTRYMMLLCRWGVYLIDRAFNVRRVQVMLPKKFSSLMSYTRLDSG